MATSNCKPKYPMITETGKKLCQGWGETQGSVKDLVTQSKPSRYLVSQNGQKLRAQ